MELARAEVELETIVNHYDRANISPAFVFNVDESGFQHFVDIVPEIQKRMIKYNYQR